MIHSARLYIVILHLFLLECKIKLTIQLPVDSPYGLICTSHHESHFVLGFLSHCLSLPFIVPFLHSSLLISKVHPRTGCESCSCKFHYALLYLLLKHHMFIFASSCRWPGTCNIYRIGGDGLTHTGTRFKCFLKLLIVGQDYWYTIMGKRTAMVGCINIFAQYQRSLKVRFKFYP